MKLSIDKSEVRIQAQIRSTGEDISNEKEQLNENFLFHLNWNARSLYMNEHIICILKKFTVEFLEDGLKDVDNEKYGTIEKLAAGRLEHYVRTYFSKLAYLPSDNNTNDLSVLCNKWEVEALEKALTFLTGELDLVNSIEVEVV